MIKVYEYKHKKYEVYKPSDESHPSTGYYLTKEEYENLQSELSKYRLHAFELETKLDQIKKAHESEIRQLKENYAVSLDDAHTELESKYATELYNEYNEKIIYKKQAEAESELNRNLKRIARERANKKRNLDKKDSGYLIMNWKPITYQLKNDDEIVTIPLYTISVQTPWDCSLSLKEVDALICKDIADGILHISQNDDGFLFVYNLSLPDAINSTINNNQPIENMILTRKYFSNVKTSLWEVTFTTGFEPIVDEKHRKIYV